MSNTSQMQVLLVDDEPDARDLIALVLRNHGIEVIPVDSAEEALVALESCQPTLAIIDLALPNMNGWQLLEAIRSHPTFARLPAVAITAYDSSGVEVAAAEAGFDGYFPKPLNSRTLYNDLASVIANRRTWN